VGNRIKSLETLGENCKKLGTRLEDNTKDAKQKHRISDLSKILKMAMHGGGLYPS
jgi:hypothetical protein